MGKQCEARSTKMNKGKIIKKYDVNIGEVKEKDEKGKGYNDKS